MALTPRCLWPFGVLSRHYSAERLAAQQHPTSLRLEELESRLTPSTRSPAAQVVPYTAITYVPPTLPMAAAHAPLVTAIAPAKADVAALADKYPLVKVDFANVPPTSTYSIELKLTAADGTTYSNGYNITNLSPTQVRDLVLNDLNNNSSFVTQANGTTGIDILYAQNVQKQTFSAVTQIGLQSADLKPNQQPGIGAEKGIKQGQLQNGQFKFSFLPTGDTGIIQVASQVQATIDGVNIHANLTAGMVPTQVAQALYNAMLTAGVTDATLSGSDIYFSLDTSGQMASTVGLTFTGSLGSPPANWLEADITLPPY